MTDHTLQNCRILIVEDEFMLADELAQEFRDAGAIVLGPVRNIHHALAMLKDQRPPDGAILDVNLGGVAVYPLADILLEQDVPLIFTTGYDLNAIPDRFRSVRRCEKPIDTVQVAAVVCRAIHERGAA